MIAPGANPDASAGAGSLDALDTPCLLLDREVLDRNTLRMSGRMRRLGVNLRPHLKTAKCAEVAARATAGHSGGITVSTLREAEYFLERGFEDLLYAVGMVPARVPRVEALQSRGARLTLITDDPDVAAALGSTSRAAPLRVLVEVDTGGARAGVAPEADALLEVAGALHAAPGVELAGVMTHAGHSYHAADAAGARAVAVEERDGVVRAAARLRAAGLPCPVVSAGSTPTAVHAHDLAGVTEMRPGVYVFFDLFQLAIGSCAREDLALSVLATVIGHHRRDRHLLIDAGALALSKDLSANQHREVGLGEVCGALDGKPLGPLRVAHAHQEHGIVPVPDAAWFDALPVGARVRVYPNHACMTAAAHDRYHVVTGAEVKAVWTRVNGW